MKCLVTGGAGFIGSNLVIGLLEKGHEVRVLDNLSTGHRANLDPVSGQIDFREEDIRDVDATRSACEGIEVVYHEAALPSVPRSVADPRASHEVNAGGTLNLLLSAREAGVRRVIYAASSSAYGNSPTLPKHEDMIQRPLSPYAADKVHGENLCRVFHATYGLDCVCLRYFNVFGPHQRPDSAYAAVVPKFIRALLDDCPPVIHGDGGQSRDFTYIENVIQANFRAAEVEAKGAPGMTFNVGCGKAATLLELLGIISGILGKQIAPIHEESRVGDVRDSLASTTLISEILGYAPTVGLEEGLRKTVAWFKNQGDPQR